jgi:hypothetical protein
MARQASGCSHIGPPKARWKSQKTSLDPNRLTMLLTPRSAMAALKRSVCETIHDVMKPP